MFCLLLLLILFTFANADYACFDKYLWQFENCVKVGDIGCPYKCLSVGNNSPQINFTATHEVCDTDVGISHEAGEYYVKKGIVDDIEISSGNPAYIIVSVWSDPYNHLEMKMFGIDVIMNDGNNGMKFSDGVEDLECVECYYDEGPPTLGDIRHFIFVFVTVHNEDGQERLLVYHDSLVVFAHHKLTFDLTTGPQIELKLDSQGPPGDEKYFKMEVIKTDEYLYEDTLELLYEESHDGDNFQLCQNYTCSAVDWGPIDDFCGHLETCHETCLNITDTIISYGDKLLFYANRTDTNVRIFLSFIEYLENQEDDCEECALLRNLTSLAVRIMTNQDYNYESMMIKLDEIVTEIENLDLDISSLVSEINDNELIVEENQDYLEIILTQLGGISCDSDDFFEIIDLLNQQHANTTHFLLEILRRDEFQLLLWYLNKTDVDINYLINVIEGDDFGVCPNPVNDTALYEYLDEIHDICHVAHHNDTDCDEWAHNFYKCRARLLTCDCECSPKDMEMLVNHECVPITCYGYDWNDFGNVCSGHGQCVWYNTCECFGAGFPLESPGYQGDQCEIPCID
jgi:hypothetical protein